MKKRLLLLLGVALLLSGCTRGVELPDSFLRLSCHRAPIPVQLQDIRSVEINELGITLEEAQHALLHAMSESRCFVFDAPNRSYAAELLYSSRILQETQVRDALSYESEYRTFLVVEATLTLRDAQSFRQHQGVATRQIFRIESTPKIGVEERRQTLELAIRGALKEAIESY